MKKETTFLVSMGKLQENDCRVQLHNKHWWNIRKGKAYRVIIDFQTREEFEIIEKDIESIFNQIKIVMINDKIVARSNGEYLVAEENSLLLKANQKEPMIDKPTIAFELYPKMSVARRREVDQKEEVRERKKEIPIC